MKKIVVLSIFIILTSCSQKKSKPDDLEKSKSSIDASLETENQSEPNLELNKEIVLGNYTGNAKTEKEYPLLINKTNIEITPLPTSIEGTYSDEICNLTLSIFKSKGECYYNYKSLAF